MPETEGGICYTCKNVQWDISSKETIMSDSKTCSKGYLFLHKKCACIGHDPIVV